MMIPPPQRRVALVMGVANRRSIAWACAQSLLQRNNMDCILTYQSERYAKTIQKLLERQQRQQSEHHNSTRGRILGALPCDVAHEIPRLFQEDLPRLWEDSITKEKTPHKLDAIVHSIAYSSDMMTQPLLSQATWSQYATAQQISSYSFLQVAQCATEFGWVHQNNINAAAHDNDDDENNASARPSSSLIALTYLGATRAVPNYQCMGPAKAALEATVRSLAAEYGPTHGLHVNAVSAGPVPTTLAARGIAHLHQLTQHVEATAPLRRTVSPTEIGNLVAFLSNVPHGISGQTIYVDAGYSSVVPVS